MSSGEIRFRQIIEDLTATALEVFYVQPNTVGRGGLTTNSCLNYNRSYVVQVHIEDERS